MSDTVFVQFYNRTKGGYWDLSNGFSDTSDLCRQRGEMVWLQHETSIDSWYREETYTRLPSPASSGTVYVSAVYLNHLYQALVWARDHPRVQFVVGGPVAAEQSGAGDGWKPLYFRVEKSERLPANLTVTGRSLESWFGVADFSGPWRLEIPPEVPAGDRIYFSYTLDNHCYWHRCIYCNIACHAPEHFRARREMGYEFAGLNHPGTRIVRLNTGSLSPAHIRGVLPALPRDEGLEYRLFMRAAGGENVALREILGGDGPRLPPMVVGLGIEFPSDRMLRHVGKGAGREELLDTLAICRANGIRVNGNFILGWDNLLEEDLRQLEGFLARVPDGSLTTMQVRWLFAHPYTPIHETYRGPGLRLGPLYCGFRVEIDRRQRETNRQAADLLTKYAERKGFRLEGLAGIYRDHLGGGVNCPDPPGADRCPPRGDSICCRRQ